MAKKNAKPVAKQDSRKAANSPKDGTAKKQSVSKQPAGAPKAEGDGFSAGEFVQGTQEELAKVIWPTRQQLISESAAVILMVGLSATIIYLVDNLFGWASRQIF